MTPSFQKSQNQLKGIVILLGISILLMVKNYLLNLPTWSNLIGLYHKNTCVMSFANFPNFKKILFSF